MKSWSVYKFYFIQKNIKSKDENAARTQELIDQLSERTCVFLCAWVLRATRREESKITLLRYMLELQLKQIL